MQIRISRESSPEWAARHGYFYAHLTQTTAQNLAQGENNMIYTNELPSNLLSMETFMRLSKLGCAVTAGQKTARKQEQSTRASGASKRGSGSARIAAIVYGNAASL